MLISPQYSFARYALRSCLQSQVLSRSAASIAVTARSGKSLSNTLLDKYRTEIRSAARLGQFSDAFKACQELKEAGIRPDVSILADVMDIYSSTLQHEKAFQIYNELVALGVSPTTRVLNALLRALEYKGGATSKAKAMQLLEDFRKMGVYPDSFSYIVLMNIYAKAGDFNMMWHYYEKNRGIPQLKFSLFNMLDAAMKCEQSTKVEQVCADILAAGDHLNGREREIYELYLKWGYVPGLISFFARFKEQLEEGPLIKLIEVSATKDFVFSHRVYEYIRQKHQKPSVYTFYAMLFACANNNKRNEFLDTVNTMAFSGYRPIFVLMDKFAAICATRAEMDDARSYLEQQHQLQKPVAIDVLNTLIYACGQGGETGLATILCDELQKYGLTPDVGTLNSLMAGCLGRQDLKGAFTILSQIRAHGLHPSADTYNILMDICYKKADLPAAIKVMSMVQDDSITPTYNMYSCLAHLCTNEDKQHAKRIVRAMRGLGMTPDVFIAADTAGG